MGSVWRAEHLLLRSQVAIKLISPDLASSREGLSRFLREAQAAAALRSPHVVQILDYGVDDGTPYIAMELLEGESLGARLERIGRITAQDTGALFVQLGRAIARAHDAGIIHRDLKPDNIFIVRNDEDEIAKVLDFGIAKLSTLGVEGPVTGATRTGALLGTPYYMSPEQVEGSSALDWRSDVWAIGVIAFECLIGQKPFDAETIGGLVLAICSKPLPIPSQRTTVPAGFDDWFACACNRDLGQRFASARDATRELKRICDQVSTSPDRSSVSEIVEPADALIVASVESYPPARHSSKSLTTFSSSQTPSAHNVALRTVLLIAAVLIATTAAALAWIRTRGDVVAQPVLVMSSVVPPVFPRALGTASARILVTPAADEPKVISVESIPTAAPVENTRPILGKPASSTQQSAARRPIAPAKIILDETPSDRGAALPENPYKAGSSRAASPARDAPGF